MSKVLYIKYKGNKRTTIAGTTDSASIVVKHDTVEPIVVIEEVSVVGAVSLDEAYDDYLTQVMFNKIHLNHLKVRKGGK